MTNEQWKRLLEKVMNGEELLTNEAAQIVEYLSAYNDPVRIAAMATALMCHYCNSTK